MSYLDLSIREIHAAYVEKKVTPLELTKEALLRAKANQDNCFEYICEKEALEFAEKLTEVEEDNLLWGIPYVAKDNLSTKGIPTCASSNILKGYVPIYDARVIEILKEKKAVLIGKTTLDELAMGGSGMTGHLGYTYNPYDPDHKRMIGGSSCGSASATAASIVPFALGSDTGDSVRKPASYGGLVGFKPTWGRISRYGLFPFAPSMDHVGFFTRHVEDAAIVLNALSGRDDRDSTSSFKPVEDYLEATKAKKQYKVAVIPEIVDSISDKELLAEFNKTLDKLKENGACIDYVHMDPASLSSIYATYFVISCAEATSNNANLDGIKFGPFYEGNSYQEVMRKARTNGFSELIKRRFVIGSFALMSENQEELFLRAQRNRAKIVSEVNAILKDHDFIFVPAAPSVAPLFNASGDKLSSEYLIADNHMAIGNFGGLPSITVPFALENGFPLGANITGRAFEDGAVLNFAKQVEDVTGLGGLSAKKEDR